MNEIMSNGSFTSLELVELINQFRNKEGSKTSLRHDTMLGIIRDEFEEEISLQNILESNYKNDRGKEYPMFILNPTQSKQVLVRESKFVRKAVIAHIDKLESELEKTKLPQTYKEALIALVESIEEREKLESEKQQLLVDVTHKEDVIIGLVEDIDLATKRQRISQIIKYRFGGSDKVTKRWNLLYNEFEKKYHVDIKRRMNSPESMAIKPKYKNKLDYIDRKMEMIPQLYELACKLFENDIERLRKEWEATISNI